MNKMVLSAITAAILSGCTTYPSLVDSSVNHATPSQFVAASESGVLDRAYEQRVRQRADELYRTRQVGSVTEADKKARDELSDRYTPSNQTEPARKTTVNARSALDQKALNAAADELSRQRSQ